MISKKEGRNVTRAYIRQTIGGCADRSTYTQQPAVSTMDPDYSYYDSLAEDMHLPLRGNPPGDSPADDDRWDNGNLSNPSVFAATPPNFRPARSFRRPPGSRER
jgi:hypothetical protein